MRPLNMPPSSHRSGTPVRGHHLPYGAPAPAGYPYYPMPPHSHMPPPPPGYAPMHVGSIHQSAGNPVSPDMQGNMHPKHHQFPNPPMPYHAVPSSAAPMKRTPQRSSNGTRQHEEGQLLPFSPSTGSAPQRVAHPSPPRSSVHAPGKFVPLHSCCIFMITYLSSTHIHFFMHFKQ